jgi:hypothetical protein
MQLAGYFLVNPVCGKPPILVYVEMGSYETKSTRGVTYQIPVHKFCLVSGLMSAGDNGTCKIRPSGNDWFLDMVGYNGSSTQTCWVSCLD